MAENKDKWDKFSIIASALIPVSIALVGGFYSLSMKDAEMSVSKDQLKIAKINAKVDQAKLVHTFLESLTSDNEGIRKIAIKSVLIALPVEGEKLIEILSVSDESKYVRAFAEKEIQRFKAMKALQDLTFRICSTTEMNYSFSYVDNGRIYMNSEKGGHRFMLDTISGRLLLDIFELNKPSVVQTKLGLNNVDYKEFLNNTGSCMEQIFEKLKEKFPESEYSQVNSADAKSRAAD